VKGAWPAEKSPINTPPSAIPTANRPATSTHSPGAVSGLPEIASGFSAVVGQCMLSSPPTVANFTPPPNRAMPVTGPRCSRAVPWTRNGGPSSSTDTHPSAAPTQSRCPDRHTRAVPQPAADNATVAAGLSCEASQINTPPSAPAEASRLPSGENASARTAAV
jgi:hypothetical protein